MAALFHSERSTDGEFACDVVVLAANLVGIPANDIAANVLGALAIDGVFDILKTLAATTFAVGVTVDWDGSGAVAGAGGDVLGTVVEASANGDTTVRVKINRV